MNVAMKVIEPISEDEMVLAWAEAERDSMGAQGFPLAESPTPDEARKGLAFTRGYPSSGMFLGWPDDVVWKRVMATVAEIGGFLHCGYWTFRMLTNESLLPRDAAANIDMAQDNGEMKDLTRIVPEIADAIRGGERFKPLIAVAEDDDDQPIIAEGNKRSMAYQLALAPDEEIEIFFGTSPGMSGWHFFNFA
jgi:hypothetical protein